MNGLEFLRELRSDATIKHIPVVVFTTSNEERDRIETYCLNVDIPVVVFTTSNEERDRIETYCLNVAGYIRKPATFDRFMEILVTLNEYWTLCEMT